MQRSPGGEGGKKKKTGAWDKPERLERRGYKQTDRKKEWLKKKKFVWVKKSGAGMWRRKCERKKERRRTMMIKRKKWMTDRNVEGRKIGAK